MFKARLAIIVTIICLSQIKAQWSSGPNGQWGPPRGDSRCGPDFGMAGCQQNECCSPAGFCGNTPAHCGGASPMMGPGMNQGGMVRDDGRCGPDFGAVCASGQCCSPAGYCGDGPMYCGGGGYGGQTYGGYGGQSYGGSYNQMQSNGYYSGPPNGQWNDPRDDGQCGPDYNWAGCNYGSCCGGDQYCGPEFC